MDGAGVHTGEEVYAAMPRLARLPRRLPVFRTLLVFYVFVAIGFILLIRHGHVQLLRPAGYIAGIQSRILLTALILAGSIGGALVTTFFWLVFRYKEGNRARYEPTWVAGKKLQVVGWLVPLIAVVVLSVIIWDTAQVTDPYRPINSSAAPVTIQVVALRWKWLFIYPNDRVATVNLLEIPTGTPIALQLTADAPMNSFWVPRLSGQVYAMTGMVTQLHIEADRAGDYAGSPAEISGDGFAGMDFTVRAVTPQQYSAWKTVARQAPQSLDYAAYTQLAKPTSYVAPATYRLADRNLFSAIVMQFMEPGGNSSAPLSIPRGAD